MIMRRMAGLLVALALTIGPSLAFAEDGVRTSDSVERAGAGKAASIAQAQEESTGGFTTGYILGGVGAAALGVALVVGLGSGGGDEEAAPSSPPATSTTP